MVCELVGDLSESCGHEAVKIPNAVAGCKEPVQSKDAARHAARWRVQPKVRALPAAAFASYAVATRNSTCSVRGGSDQVLAPRCTAWLRAQKRTADTRLAPSCKPLSRPCSACSSVLLQRPDPLAPVGRTDTAASSSIATICVCVIGQNISSCGHPQLPTPGNAPALVIWLAENCWRVRPALRRAGMMRQRGRLLTQLSSCPPR